MHSAHHARETIDLLHQETPDFIPPNLWHPNIPDLDPIDYKIWVIMQSRVYQTAWKNGGWSTSGVALNSRLPTWLLTTSVEDFKRASIRKEDHLNTTCELTILILSVSVTSSVTFIWMLPCYIFHSKRCNICLQHRQLRLQECLF